MDSSTRLQLQRSFLALGARHESGAPVYAALCRALGAGPSPAATEIFSRFGRIISATHLNPALLLAGLHHAALRGDAPGLARFLPTCGGTYATDEAAALAATAEEALAANREDVLDFMLSEGARPPEPWWSAPLVLGALAAAESLGGGLSLVELGCGGGVNLNFDRYAYSLGGQVLGDGHLVLDSSLSGRTQSVSRLLAGGLPAVAGRRGLDADPLDLTNPSARQAAEAFLLPDEAERLARVRGAAAVLTGPGRPAIRRGEPVRQAEALLVEAYNAMEPGNTLLLFHTLFWSGLTDEERKALALAVQRLAAQLQPHKPFAWLQVEPFVPGGPVEMRLHTFGWTDQEDRAVRILAEVDPDRQWINWQE